MLGVTETTGRWVDSLHAWLEKTKFFGDDLGRLTAVVLVIGIWAVAHGVADIVMAIRIRREVKGEWALALAGIVQIALGVMLIMRPGSGALALLWLIGTFLLLMGLLLVALALRLRRLGKEMGEATPAAA